MSSSPLLSSANPKETTAMASPLTPCSSVGEKIQNTVKATMNIEEQPKRTVALEQYYFKNGLRFVIPYSFDFRSNVKSRWYNRTIIDIYRTEFPYLSQRYVEEAIKSGQITINAQIVEPDFKLKRNMVLCRTTHRHELPVIDQDIEFLDITDKLVVIDKPGSIPCHPCGRYRKNSITKILEAEYGLGNLHLIHRLDRMTSGVLVMARNSEEANKMQSFMSSGEIHKVYLARVKGKFPHVDETLDMKKKKIVVEQNLQCKDHRRGIWEIHPQGKECKTVFYGIDYNAELDASLVLCKPITGRTHQIRLHLQYLSHPIANDPCYYQISVTDKNNLLVSAKENDEEEDNIDNVKKWYDSIYETEAKTPHDKTSSLINHNNHPPTYSDDQKSDCVEPLAKRQRLNSEEKTKSSKGDGSDGQEISAHLNTHTDTSMEEKSITSECSSENTATSTNGSSSKDEGTTKYQNQLELKRHKRKLMDYDDRDGPRLPNCYECNNPPRETFPEDLIIYLHAWIYISPGWKYRTSVPVWASKHFEEEKIIKVVDYMEQNEIPKEM